MGLSVIILAAGRGTRMNTSLPKVLHVLAGKPLLEHVIDTAALLNPIQILSVVGYKADQVIEACSSKKVSWVYQGQQLGTGDAVASALPKLSSQVQQVLVLSGDVPMISPTMLRQFIQQTPKGAVGVVTTSLANPEGLGRVIRDQNNLSAVVEIVEEIDATEQEKSIQEINAGIYLIPRQYLDQWLPSLSNLNNSGEYYLPEVIKLAVQSNVQVKAFAESDVKSLQGINNQSQLALVEREYQRRQAELIMQQGVTLADPARFDVRGSAEFGKDIFIDINVVLEGCNQIGNGVVIEPNVIIKNSKISDGAKIAANSVIDSSIIGKNCLVGPFARVRADTVLESNAQLGNFVETKNVTVGAGSKIKHLSYIGDAKIGSRVNIGASTVTCNYDGVNKHQTIIRDGASVGAATQLIAPISVGEKATIAAGTTLIKDAPANQLTLNRKVQESITKEKT